MKIKNLRKIPSINLFITILFISLFAIYYSSFLNYGLPYFLNADEGAHLKSVLYYFGFFSSANRNIVEPIFAPFFNFLISGVLIFFYNLFFLKLSIFELENFIFLNPDKLVFFLRATSLITSCFSFFILFLIIKKLKINFLFYLLITVSIFFSPFVLDVSLIAGKNASLLLFFLLQLYLFIKYYLKISSFNIKSYIIFSILASLSWGINYWCATPSIYGVALLHYNKYKFKKFKYLFIFLFIFLIFGIFPNLLLTSDNPLIHLFDNTIMENYENSSKINKFYQDIKSTFYIFFNFEKLLLFALIISYIFAKYLTKIEKGLIFSIFFLSIEPAILFAVASYSYPQLRYFGPSIILIHLLIFIILDRAVKSKDFNFKFSIIFYVIIIILFITFFDKIKLTSKYLRVLNNNYNQYEAFNYLKDSEKKTIIITPALYRENINNLNFFEFLLSNKLIVLNPDADNKNSFEQLIIKKNKIEKSSRVNIYPNSKQFIFFGGEYLIQNEYDFLNEVSKKFQFILIHAGYTELINILKKNYKLEKSFENDGAETARGYLSEIRSTKFSNIKKLGPTLYLFKLK